MSRTIIKTVFACWIGIFLILPACLCQVFACVGIDLHGERHSEAAFIAPAFPSALDCHCEDSSGKVAESTPTDLAGRHVLVWLKTSPEPGAFSQAPLALSSRTARAPPSGALPAAAPQFCALISVWLV